MDERKHSQNQGDANWSKYDAPLFGKLEA